MRLFFSILLVCSLSFSFASDLEQAPKNFSLGNAPAVFVDFQTAQMDVVFDVSTRTAQSNVKVTFYQPANGYPLFDLVPSVKGLKIDNKVVTAELIQEVSSPDSSTRFRAIKKVLPAGHHTMEISYQMNTKNLVFNGGGAHFGTFMSDLSTRTFLEQYFPTNFEYDQYQGNMTLKIVNASYEHRVMCNGDLKSLGYNHFSIAFPNYFTTSSFYVHIINPKQMTILEEVYSGLNAEIPLVVYAKKGSLAQQGMTNLKKFMKELEGTFGAYTHKSFVAYMTPGGGGMEHCGATITSLWALGHELTHSWFARGIMSANGNSGWMDEAIASWRDAGYPRPKKLTSRSPVNLSAYSQYKRHTTRLAYSKGKTFISELDYLLKNEGGMRKQLKEFFGKNQRKPINTSVFERFLQSKSKQGLNSYFSRYVYGKGADITSQEEPSKTDSVCRPFSEEELAELLY